MTESAESASAVGQPSDASAPRKLKTVVGSVRSDKMNKTIIVDVLRMEKHRMYHKFVRRRTSYKAHDEKGEARIGDLVRIAETRPLSKTKRWRLVEVLRRAKSLEPDTAPAENEPQGGES